MQFGCNRLKVTALVDMKLTHREPSVNPFLAMHQTLDRLRQQNSYFGKNQKWYRIKLETWGLIQKPGDSWGNLGKLGVSHGHNRLSKFLGQWGVLGRHKEGGRRGEIGVPKGTRNSGTERGFLPGGQYVLWNDQGATHKICSLLVFWCLGPNQESE